MRDNNFEHLRHEADDDQRATQRLRFRPNLLGENAVADNGIIESVTCVNFMCHQRLQCDLGPLLNFIVGENGSGKSAILTAITLCLGGKASSTNRGGSLKSFIKEGCDRALLTVKIKNCGPDAYKPDIYGESIIVERFFSKAGTSGFRVKTAPGQTISTKKQEVDELVEYYALQVDNPLNVLSQDNARQFLSASTSHQKYKFFIEGVQLQQLDNDYRLISENLEQMVAKIPDQEDRVKYAKAALEKAQRLKEEVEGSKQIRLKIRTLRYQLAWAQVVEEERKLSDKEREIQELTARTAEMEQEAEAKNQALELADEKVKRAEDHLNLVREDEDALQRRVEDAEEVYQRLKKEVAELHIQEREAHQSLKAKTEAVKHIEERMAIEEKRLQDKNGEAHTALMRELDELKAEEKQIEQDIEENRNREPELINKQDDAKVALDKIGEEVQRKREEIKGVEANIKRLEGNRGSPYDAYESQIPNLLRLIDNEAGFETKPIGPLGTHVQLLQPRWSSILEKTLGNTLNGFLVTSKRDEKLLWGLMNRVGVRNSPIFICNRNPLTLQGKEPDAEYDTILRVLRIDNQMVRDQLIINHMIEQIILIPERVRAQEVMFDGAPPRNVKGCLSFHDRKRNQGLRLANNNGNISTSPVEPNPKLRPRMKTDSEAQIALQKESLQQIETECRAVVAEQRRLQQEHRRCEAGLAQHKKNKDALEKSLKSVQVKINGIHGQLDEFEGDGTRLQGLRGHHEELKAEQNHYGIQYGMLSVKKQDKNKEVEEAQKRRKEAKLQKNDFDERLNKAEAKVQRARELRHICLIEKNDIISRAGELADQLHRAQERRQRQEEAVQHMTGEAKKVSPERIYVPEGETYDSIEKQYVALRQREHSEERRRGMTEQQVHDYYSSAKAAYDKVATDLDSIRSVNDRLKDTLTLRLEKWRKFQRYISSQSRANFIYLLSERGFRGKLLLDHENKALDLHVEPDRNATQSKGQSRGQSKGQTTKTVGRSTKTLSGGEKSFSSICLLLAIWEAMGSPLRCLDEFDVFMDNVNRAISTNMLVSGSLKKERGKTVC